MLRPVSQILRDARGIVKLLCAMLVGTNCHPMWTDAGTLPSTWFAPWAKTAATGGYKSIRFDVAWSSYNCTALTDVLSLLRSLNIVPIVSLGSSGPNWQPPDQWAYAAVAGQIASTLHAGEYIEIWNEPNQVPQFSPSSDPNAYAHLTWLASTFIHAANSKVLVLAGSIAFNDQAYINAFLSAFPNRAFDLLSIHPYTTDKPPDQVADKFHSFTDACRFANSLGIPWGITEVGWTSELNHSYNADIDARSASYYRAAREIASIYRASLFTSYELGDAWNHGSTSTEMALLNTNMSPRLTFAAANNPLVPSPAVDATDRLGFGRS